MKTKTLTPSLFSQTQKSSFSRRSREEDEKLTGCEPGNLPPPIPQRLDTRSARKYWRVGSVSSSPGMSGIGVWAGMMSGYVYVSGEMCSKAEGCYYLCRVEV